MMKKLALTAATIAALGGSGLYVHAQMHEGESGFSTLREQITTSFVLHHNNASDQQTQATQTTTAATPSAQPAIVGSKNETNKNEVNIVAVGDMMIGSWFPNVGFLPDDDAKNSFAQVTPYLVGDVVFGNLEGVLLDSGTSTKCGKNSRSCYAFAMPERYGQIIKNAGFTLLSTANNHAGDFGDVGRFNTGKVLDRLGVHHAGQKEAPCTNFEKDGIKYGMCAFSPNRNMININDTATAKKLVGDLAAQVDVMIVSFHGGAEGATHTHVPKRPEIFLGENRGDVHYFAHQMIDVGADVVLGHGPHVTRAVELYKDRFITYSMGNFNTYGAFNLRGVNGIAPLFNIRTTRDGAFIDAKVTSTKQTKEAGLMIDPQAQVYQELQQLTQTDFPETPLRFENQMILKK